MAFFSIHSMEAQALSSLPVIPLLDVRDMAFKQYLQDVEASRALLFTSRQNPAEPVTAANIASSMTIYAYTPKETDEFLAIAARCNIPYSTLASLNRFSHGEDMITGKIMLLPSVPGIFVSETPGNDLERLLFSARAGDGRNEGVVLSVPREGKIERFRFIPADDFTPTERVFFLNRGFISPFRIFRFQASTAPGSTL